jgi:GSCFA family
MELFTKVKYKGFDPLCLHGSKFASIGSCFSEHIAARLKRYRFDVISNPNGIVFHPMPIAQCLAKVLKNTPNEMSDIIQANSEWISLRHHGSFRFSDPSLLIEKINQTQWIFHQQLYASDVLFVTFGTAWGYHYLPTQEVVANCHKLPSSHFIKKLSEPEIMFNEWVDVLSNCLSANPKLRIVLTVSPVRHTREGLVENQRSKARLIELAHRLVDHLSSVTYFPSYEIMIDELRDYRFYEKDMIHPNDLAVDIIWDRWMKTYLTAATIETLRLMEPWLAMAEHRSIHETLAEADIRRATAEEQIQRLLRLNR